MQSLAVLSIIPLFAIASVSAQLPEAPKPHPDKIQLSLLIADASVRALDVYSTHKALSCACNHEIFLPHFVAYHPGIMAVVEASDIAAVWWIDRKLEKHGHRKMGRLHTAIDAAQDAPWAMHNLYLPRSGGSRIALP